MTSRDFVFWLQGFFELSEAEAATKKKKIKITENQADMIKRHLDLVFYHEIDPSYSNDQEVQEKMNEIHEGSDDLEVKEVKPTLPNTKPFVTTTSKPSSGIDSGSMFPSEKNTVYRC